MRPSIAALVCFSLILAAPSSSPGATMPAPVDRLKPYENVWRYSATLADGSVKVQGLWTDRLDAVTIGGRTLFRRVQGMTYVSGLTSATINVFDPDTMLAISSEIHKVDGTWLKRTFDGTSVTETRGSSPADKTGVVTSASLPQPVYDFWGGMYGTLFAAMPLKVGLKGSLPSIAEFEPSPKPASFEVVGEEDVPAGRLGTVHAFVVKSEGMTFWISKAAPYILRLDIAMGNGVTANYSEL